MKTEITEFVAFNKARLQIMENFSRDIEFPYPDFETWLDNNYAWAWRDEPEKRDAYRELKYGEFIYEKTLTVYINKLRHKCVEILMNQ